MADADALRALGPLALGSRLRRLSERLMADGSRVYREAGLDFEPRWFSLFQLLAHREPLTITEAARELGVSHAAVSQTAREMQRRRLLSATRDPQDQRKRRLALTPEAFALLPRLQPIWNDFEAGAEGLLETSAEGLLQAVDDIEEALESRGLRARVAALAARRGATEILDFHPDLAPHFEQLNREWLERWFELDDLDRRVMADPMGVLIEPGGAVFFARHDGAVVGTCGLQRVDANCFELVKLAVTEAAQGLGIGAQLVRTALRTARQRGARRVVIETSSKLAAANRLYHRVGFRPDPTASAAHERGDTRLTLDLGTRWRRSLNALDR